MTSSLKTSPPQTSGLLVARPAVEARLTEVLRRRLVSVVAGPGYGKSTLLASFARAHRCAWYTLGWEDRDPNVLDRFTADLAEHLGVAHAAETLASLERRGLLTASLGSGGQTTGDRWCALHPLLRDFAATRAHRVAVASAIDVACRRGLVRTAVAPTRRAAVPPQRTG
jgi:ATP/maltotriose-dependent transcriptional regulator MalT